MENKFARFLRNTGPARFFVPIGLILIIFGAILLGMNSGNLEKTVGRITSVTEGLFDEENDQQQYDIDFAYTVDGKEYTGHWDGMTKNYKVGDEIDVYYDAEDPAKVTNTRSNLIGIIMIALGALAAAFGIFKTVKAFRKSKELDAATPGKGAPAIDFDAYKYSGNVTEYYFRWDGISLKPGYLIEDADRNVLFEGKMLKNALVGARTFQFTDHTTGMVKEHDVGHTTTQTWNDEMFSAKSWFKFDGENIWDLIHGRGVRLITDLRSKFPNITYNAAKDGAAFARIESTGQYVHEDDAAQHKLNIPNGMFYRIWTDSKDMETLFLTAFALAETNQTVVE